MPNNPEHLKVGDPWTFVSLTEEQMANTMKLGVGGQTSRWYSTAEPGRLFKITALHPKMMAVETIYMGFDEYESDYVKEKKLKESNREVELLASMHGLDPAYARTLYNDFSS